MAQSRRRKAPAAPPPPDRAAAAAPPRRETQRGAPVLGDRPGPPRTILGIPRLLFTVSVGMLFAGGAILILSIFFGPEDGPPVSGVERFPDQGRRLLAAGEVFDGYNSTPPTSGPHAAEGAAPGIYGPAEPAPFNAPPAAPTLLRNLAEGGLVIYARPDLPAAAAAEVRAYVQQRADSGLNVVLVEQDGLPAPIVATAWRTLLPLTAENAALLADFGAPSPDGYYQRYHPEAPE